MFSIPKVFTQRRPGIFGIWTASKALLVDEYLRSFVWIARHGTYVDGFAGPKEPSEPQTWSAKRVVDRHPADPSKRRIQHFYLVDNEQAQVTRLEKLRAANPKKDVRIWNDDFNVAVDEILALIGPKEATFCLLDQYSMQCDWATVRKLAAYPKEKFKIKVFYFLATSWIDCSLSAAKPATARRWWGDDGWKNSFIGLDTWARGQLVAKRFRDELGYTFATPWPIRDVYNRRGKIMYFMVHATDHPEAPNLMERANTKTMGTAIRRAGLEPLF